MVATWLMRRRLINFSIEHFLAQGMTVAMIDLPSDHAAGTPSSFRAGQPIAAPLGGTQAQPPTTRFDADQALFPEGSFSVPL
jgi:hypothetical protein